MAFLRPVALVLALVTALPVMAGAGLPPLTKEAHVMDQLVAARVADRIRYACPAISGRMIAAFFKAESLKSYALDKGYSGDRIRAFLKDPAAKALITTRAEARLKAGGAIDGKSDSFCDMGRAEIVARSLTGSLLRD